MGWEGPEGTPVRHLETSGHVRTHGDVSMADTPDTGPLEGVWAWEQEAAGHTRTVGVSGATSLPPHPARALDLQEQLRARREELEQAARKGCARRLQSAELNRDLCRAHRWVGGWVGGACPAKGSKLSGPQMPLQPHRPAPSSQSRPSTA